MVESGSTTMYTGNGHPFPNWLVYNSSLFEVKVNGKPAFFNAPPTAYGNNYQGTGHYSSNLQVKINNNPKGFSNNFNLFVNINEDGSIPPCPYNSSDTYLNSEKPAMLMSVDGEEGDGSESNQFNLDPTKPMYIYNANWKQMSGTSYVDYDVYSLPHIDCPELNLILIYDADQRTWKVHKGGVIIDCLIEWRFKNLHDITKSPVFLNLRDLQYRSTGIHRESMLNPMVSLIPNAETPNRFEVHARTYIKNAAGNNSQVLPCYKGQTITAWPDLHSHLTDIQYKIPDPTVALIAIPKVNNSTLICRINDLPSWIVTNTITDEYGLGSFSGTFGFHKYMDESGIESGYVETDGILEISNGTTTIRYNANNAMWQVIDSDTEFVTIQLMFIRDNTGGGEYPIVSNIDYPYVVNLTEYNNTDNLLCFIGFSLANPSITSKPISAIGSTVNKFLSHERVASQQVNWEAIPNLENYDIGNYSLYVNGKLTEPLINYGVNDAIISINYYLSDLRETYTIQKAHMQTDNTFDSDMYSNQTSAFDGKVYFLDGDRLDNLDMNPTTCFFNRSLPVHIQWIYNSTIPLGEIKPLFVYATKGELSPIQLNGESTDGIYVDYYYDKNGKTATLSYAPPINMAHLYTLSLAMKHERDIVYGWKKSGYTGPNIFLYDIEIKKNTIGYPIVIKPDVIENTEADISSRLLPYLFESGNMVLDGKFTVNINGEHLTTNTVDEDIPYVLSEIDDVELITAEDDPAPSAVGYASNSDIILLDDDDDGYDIIIYDLYGNVIYDGTGNDFELVIQDSIDANLLKVSKPILPPPKIVSTSM